MRMLLLALSGNVAAFIHTRVLAEDFHKSYEVPTWQIGNLTLALFARDTVRKLAEHLVQFYCPLAREIIFHSHVLNTYVRV